MKKVAFFTAFIMLLAAFLSLSLFAYDEVQLVGTTAPPTIDGKLDDCYMKIHDFYTPDVSQWYDANDPDHKAVGEAWGTWDKDNFYCFFKIAEKDYSSQNYEAEAPGSNYSSMYLALMATLPVDDLPQDPYHVMQCCFNRSADNTLEWKYTGSVPEEFRDNSAEYAIYSECPFKFECINDGSYTYYECAMPWDQIDRTGTVKFVDGHRWFFNYIITWCDEDGAYPIVQYGQGLMNDIYDMGANMTLVPPIVVEEETAAPEAPSAAEAAPVAETPAAAPAPAAQTSDFAPLFVLLGAAALCSVAVIKKER
ncbi:MAG: hypothetical protein GX897_09540 [Clostridiales bacterium]|nr:hypothetical protein [Clostridiales bacterium]